jgi:hypothetical protein
LLTLSSMVRLADVDSWNFSQMRVIADAPAND